MVSVFGIWERTVFPEDSQNTETVGWQTYLTDEGESYVTHTIAVASAIHSIKEYMTGVGRYSTVPSWELLASSSGVVTPYSAAEKESANQKATNVPNGDRVSSQDGKKKKEKQTEDRKEQEPDEEQTVSEDVIEFQTVGDDYFDDALFIGDSRTEGFRLYSDLPNITVYAHKGFQVYTAFDRKLIQMEDGRVTVIEALNRNQGKFRKVYLMFGLNEMGWGNDELFAQSYYYLIDAVKQANPDAVVYVQSIIHVSKQESEKSNLFSNEAINNRNELLKKIAEDERAVYLDLNEIFTDEEGNLPEGFSGDGIHLKAPYIEIWREYLKAHAIVR